MLYFHRFLRNLKRVLKYIEIGTHDGSMLFIIKNISESQIVTIDLPKDHKNFINFMVDTKLSTKNF